MFCSKCGAKAPDNARFCMSCGASLYGAPILQIVKDAEGNEKIEVISGAAGIQETKEEESVPVLHMGPAPDETFVSEAKPKESADQMFQDAEALMKFGDFTLAANGFRKMSAAYPEDWRGWFGELRADISLHLDKNRYDISYTYASADEAELMRKALACHPDVSDYIAFFEGILPEWETKPHMYPLRESGEFAHDICAYAPDFGEPSLDDRNTGAQSMIRASRPESRECLIYAKKGLYYNPDSFMCWFVKQNGLADLIGMLNSPALTRRAEGLRALFRNGYREGKLIGPNYCVDPVLDAEAYRIQEEHRGDFNALIRLLRGFGVSAKYYQMAKQLLVVLPGERDERRFSVHGYSVIGRSVEVVGETAEGRVYCLVFVYPEGKDPSRLL